MTGSRRMDDNGFQDMPIDTAVALAASIDNAGKAYIQAITEGKQPAERDSAPVKDALFSMVDAMNARLDSLKSCYVPEWTRDVLKKGLKSLRKRTSPR